MEQETIHYGGQIIDCYGVWDWDSNAVIIGYWPDGTEMEEIFADGAVDWTDAVRRIVDSHDMQGCEIVELQAC